MRFKPSKNKNKYHNTNVVLILFLKPFADIIKINKYKTSKLSRVLKYP